MLAVICLAPVPAGSVTTELMHTTDWLPTLVNLAGGDVSGSALPLDGHDQWPTIAHGKPTTRKFIIHNVPITADPVLLPPDPEVCPYICLSLASVRLLTVAVDYSNRERVEAIAQAPASRTSIIERVLAMGSG